MIALLVIGPAAIAWLVWLMRAALVAARMYQIEEYEAPRFLAWGRQRAWLWPRAILAASAAVLIVGLLTPLLPTDLGRIGMGVGWLLGSVLLLHMLWRSLRFLAWEHQRAWLWSTATLVASIAVLIVGLLALLLPADLGRIGLGVAWLVGALLLHMLWRSLPAKKALVYTPRMRRILCTGLVLTLLITTALITLILTTPIIVSAIIVVLCCLLAPGMILLLMLAGNMLMIPVEAQVRQGFVRRARARITTYKPFVIGITGSYGKTSTKNIMAQLLVPHKRTLPTPKSFNTLMGITRAINENLEPKYELFLVEMDAYNIGEIAKMCDLVEPQVGMITSVGPQHLERFGSIERIADALYELVASLPAGSPAVIYGGESMSALLAERAKRAGYRAVRYGIEGEQGTPFDVMASDIVVDEHASHFTWRWVAEDLELRVSIPLLGRHNILNVSAALAVVHLLGLPVAQAARDAIRLEPAQHRLQLMPSQGGITVIDDSYNANPVGVHNGLDVLAQMRGKAKILVTPGMVELGSVEEAENKRFGEHAAQVCKHVILVGAQQTQPVLAGLQESGFPSEHIHIVETLEEVTAMLGRIAKPGDVVLFANDLPDTYLELKA
jgi:UDP-N-acetylmuramoyl-tripeptide--D-alanyl-D-alanine ligase